MSKRLISDGDYRRLTAEFNAAVARYRNAAPEAHPDDVKRAAALTAESIRIAKICGVPLADVVAEKKRELRALETEIAEARTRRQQTSQF